MTDFYLHLYPFETLGKLFFLFMSIFNTDYTIILAAAISVLALLRMFKTPQFNKEYLAKVIQHHHGLNLFYITIGGMGNVHYLFYAPLALYFAYGLVQYINQKLNNTSLAPRYMPYIDLIRNNKFYVMEGKGKLEIVYWIFCVILLPINFSLTQVGKIVILGQFFMTKYVINQDFKYSVIAIDQFFDSKTKSIGLLNVGYRKLTGLISKVSKMIIPQPRPQMRERE